MRLKEIGDGLLFDDGTTVQDYHQQTCCEHVYADWQQLQDTTIWDEEFDDVVIEGVPNAGIRVNKYFVPCYNEQNGYYSSNLRITVQRPGLGHHHIDVSAFVEDRIR